MVTYRPAKGKMSLDRHVFAGDLSAEDISVVSQIRPLVSLEYKASSHTAVVKHGVTGDVLMMLVRETTDDPWYSDGSGYRCAFGAATEPRLYANGRPVAVVLGKQFLDAAPSPQVNGAERPQLGASMVELVRKREGSSVMFHRRKKDNTRGSQVAIYNKVRGTSAVFKLTVDNVVDPIVLLVMAWFVTFEES